MITSAANTPQRLFKPTDPKGLDSVPESPKKRRFREYRAHLGGFLSEILLLVPHQRSLRGRDSYETAMRVFSPQAGTVHKALSDGLDAP